MTAAQLRLLAVLCRELVAYTIEQLDVALVGILLQRSDKSPRHGARGLAANGCISPVRKKEKPRQQKLLHTSCCWKGGVWVWGLHLRSLRILGPTPHDDVCGTRLGAQVLLVDGVALGDLLEETRGARDHAADVFARVRRDDAQQALARFLGQVGLLDDARGRVDVGQVERGARVARVEDGGQAHARLQRLYHDTVHLVVDNVPCCPEVDGIDDFIVAVVLVTVEVLGLAAVPCGRQFMDPECRFRVNAYLNNGRIVNR